MDSSEAAIPDWFADLLGLDRVLAEGETVSVNGRDMVLSGGVLREHAVH